MLTDMAQINTLLLGAIAMASVISGLFFLRSWRDTRGCFFPLVRPRLFRRRHQSSGIRPERDLPRARTLFLSGATVFLRPDLIGDRR
jgi:hypothetical protein